MNTTATSRSTFQTPGANPAGPVPTATQPRPTSDSYFVDARKGEVSGSQSRSDEQVLALTMRGCPPPAEI